jgi:hypothetical protein
MTHLTINSAKQLLLDGAKKGAFIAGTTALMKEQFEGKVSDKNVDLAAGSTSAGLYATRKLFEGVTKTAVASAVRDVSLPMAAILTKKALQDKDVPNSVKTTAAYSAASVVHIINCGVRSAPQLGPIILGFGTAYQIVETLSKEVKLNYETNITTKSHESTQNTPVKVHSDVRYDS